MVQGNFYFCIATIVISLGYLHLIQPTVGSHTFTPFSDCTTFFVLPETNGTKQIKFNLFNYDGTPVIIINSPRYSDFALQYQVPH